MSEDNQLEKEFQALAETIGQSIKDKVAMAEKLLREACDLSDKYGIPFDAGISELGQSYVPHSYQIRFGTLNRDDAAKIASVSSYELTRSNGWRTSEIC